ncbi:MAG: hypothetical protein KJO78_04225 [Alphaproteobacteria bacterium]|nr:hypothetical protein [Alphaproteobacteria bacterium]
MSTDKMIGLAGAVLIAAFGLPGTDAGAQVFPAPPEQMAEYDAQSSKTIIELQPFRREETATLASGETISLVSLNPNINATFLLHIGGETYHIENPDPGGQRLALTEAGLRLSGPDGETSCPFWSDEPGALARARESGLPFAPLCDARLYLRNAVPGSRSSLERVTDFLRDHVWKGEDVVRVVRDTLYKDRHAETSDLVENGSGACVQNGPCPARIEPRYAESAIAPIGFGIALGDPDQKAMITGHWYTAAGLDGVFVSAIQPRTISAEILTGPGNANRLDGIEGKAVAYLVAFDLGRYGLGFALGTDHPRLDWSPRPRQPARIAGLPGPDGIGDARPLVRSGMVSPDVAGRTVATFTAGFKRQHGAFKFGDYAVTDTGKHYGFIEKGVIYSKLKTGLSTLFVLNDGTVDMKIWEESDNALLPRVMHARQNGVPLVQTDPATGAPQPGERVNQWGPGNWSGSAKAELRTLRAGGCLQDYEGRRYLIYGYFSTATPSAMARTFQAYGCGHAMLLDMNALEHTYLALYPRQDDTIHVEHLITGMAQLDKPGGGGTVISRFLGYPDNRDLFYIFTREEQP